MYAVASYENRWGHEHLYVVRKRKFGPFTFYQIHSHRWKFVWWWEIDIWTDFSTSRRAVRRERAMLADAYGMQR